MVCNVMGNSVATQKPHKNFRFCSLVYKKSGKLFNMHIQNTNYLTCSLYSTWTFFIMRQCFCRIEMAWANGIPATQEQNSQQNANNTKKKENKSNAPSKHSRMFVT